MREYILTRFRSLTCGGKSILNGTLLSAVLVFIMYGSYASLVLLSAAGVNGLIYPRQNISAVSACW